MSFRPVLLNEYLFSYSSCQLIQVLTSSSNVLCAERVSYDRAIGRGSYIA